ncbi:chemotaxis protein CheW [Oryzihumus sp.]|uniref:chemotaxis protein CheW n=1 Tax=Oryzihumus sp. TaxID=1968903 RepID=UPI002EDB6788
MSDTRRLSSFAVDDGLFGLDVEHVQEVIRTPPITPVPLAPPAVLGLANLRGQVVTVLDLRTRLGLEPRPQHGTVTVVVRHDGEVVGLVADAPGDLLEVGAEQQDPPPEALTGPPAELISGTCRLPDRLLLVLDVAQAVRVPATA